MKNAHKLKSIEINDFRAFNGKKQFDFSLDNGRIADLIVMYAPNGAGKTSFFDAVEWGLTGEIDRLKNDIKANDYEGYILKNRDSLKKVTSISIKFDGDRNIERETRKINGRTKKDYTAGKLEDENAICNSVDWKSLILPHNKIDGVISATNPIEKYNYWGSYWDPSGSERKVFEFIYKMKKQAENQMESNGVKIKDIIAEIKQLSLNDEKLQLINKYINRYNELSISSDNLIKLHSELPSEFYEQFTNSLSEIHKNLKGQYDKYQSALNQLTSLKADYEKYCKQLRQKKKLQKRRDLWSNIIKQTDAKIENIEKRTVLLHQIEQYKQISLKLDGIYNKGENWIIEYLNYIDTLKVVKTTADSREEILKSLNSWANQKSYIALEINNKYQEIRLLDDIKEKLRKDVNQINKDEKRLKSYNKASSKLENIERKIDNNLSELQFVAEEICNLQISSKEYLDLDITTILQSTIEFDERFSTESEFLIEHIKEFMDLEKEALAARANYVEAENLSKELNNIIKNGRDYIFNNKSKICPLCKAEYSNMEELINRSISEIGKSINVQMKYDIWCKNQERLQQKNEELSIFINDWNDFIDIIERKNMNNLDKYAKRKKRVLNLNDKISEKINKVTDNIANLHNKSRNVGFDENVFSEKNVDIWVEKKSKVYSEILFSYKTQLDTYEQYIATLNKDLLKLENKYVNAKNNKEIFENTVGNNELVNDLTNFQLQCNWKTICEEKLKNETYLEKAYEDDKKIKIAIEKYSCIDTDKKEYYKEKYVECDDEFNFKSDEIKEYIERYISFSGTENINIESLHKKYEEISTKFTIAKQKIDALNGIISQVAFSDYFKRLQELKEKKDNMEKEKSKYSKALVQLCTLFDTAKSKLEEKVTGIFNEALMNDIYQKIDPHPFMKKLKYEISFNESDKPELNIYVVDDEGKEKYLPEWYFSSAQLNVVALSTFLGRALSLSSAPVNTIFIDDPIGHFDDINMIAFVDLLRSLIEFKHCQIIISTHDESIFNLIKRKIPDQYYKSKFIEFKSIGEFVCC